MGDLEQPVVPLINLSISFKKVFLEVCSKGYSVLNRTPLQNSDNFNLWQYGSGHPPSSLAAGRYRLLKTLEIAQSLQPKSILDVAGAGGFTGACLYETGRRVVVNDLRVLEDEVQKWLPGKKIETAWGNFFDLKPESLGHFDLVMACEVIEHVAYGARMINHLKQFVSPGGSLLLTTPNGAYFRSKLPTYSQISDFSMLENDQFKPDGDGHLYLYTPDEIHDLLKTLGLKDISIDLSITPLLSGNMGLRLLPYSQFLTPMYYNLDRWLKK